MSHMIAKKQEEWNSEKVRELLRLPENKKCFDCPTKSPFFVNVSIQTFLCTRCSGLVREVGHRVKSISASKFSGPEIVALQHGGNQVASTIWLSTYRLDTPEPETDGDIRLFMRQKYFEQKWLDRKKGIEHAENVKRIITELYAPDGTRKPNAVGRNVSMDKRRSMDIRPKIVPTQSWVDDNVPIGMIPAVQHNKNAFDDLLLNEDRMLSPKSPQFPTISSTNTPFINPPSSNRSILNPPASKPMSPVTTVSPTTIDIFSELAGLSTHTPIASPNYSGGILQPNAPNITTIPKPHIAPMMTPQPQPQPQQHKYTVYKEDPYAALRDLSIGSKPPAVGTPSMNTLKIQTSDDTMSWGDFQKSPTKMSFNKPMFSDLDPLFK